MFSSGFGAFDNDPFFTGHHDRMQQLFGQSAAPPALMGSHGQRQNAGNDLMPFSMGMMSPDRMFGDMMGQMNSMMRSMHGMASNGSMMQMSQGGPGGHSYMQSSVYSYNANGPDGKPEIYEAHHSNRTAPGGVREEKKALRDSTRNLEKMSVGRHIRDRAHVVEKKRNTLNDDMEEHQELIGMGEEEVDEFQNAWRSQTTRFNDVGPARLRDDRRRDRSAAICYDDGNNHHRQRRRHRDQHNAAARQRGGEPRANGEGPRANY